MKTYFSIDSFSPKNFSIISIGAFDGIHLGHLSLIEKVVLKSLEKNFSSILLSFNPHPRKILGKEDHFKYLSLLCEKIKLVQRTKIEHFIVEPFTKELASLDSEKFIQILVEKLHMKSLIVGYDHHLGSEREGNFENLKKLSKKYDFFLEAIPPFKLEGHIVSSTQIKKALLLSDLAWANKALTSPYGLFGKVVHGDKLGKKLGFPTANLNFDRSKFLPRYGVYAVKVIVKNKDYFGLLNLGIKPTFSKEELKAEVYILDFDEVIYDQEIYISFLLFIREEKKFSSTIALTSQIQQDEKKARKFFASLA